MNPLLRIFAYFLAATVGIALGMTPASAQERITHGLFQPVRLYRPPADVQQFVLLLSDVNGWDADAEHSAQALAARGALVGGIDYAQLRRALDASGGDCVFPDGDLENLSHYLQGYARVPGYYKPLVVGIGAGAALAYAMAAAAPAELFGGAIGLRWCPQPMPGKPLCADKRSGYVRNTAQGQVLQFVPQLAIPWRLVVDDADACLGARGADFAAQMRSAGYVSASLLEAYTWLAQQKTDTAPPPAGALADLPLVEVPSSVPGDTFAVLLSGDGGWAGLDKRVAAHLAARGLPVVGMDSLRYFWSARTPEGLAADLDRILRHYAARWQRPRAVLIGYSQGANVLPFAVNRLPAATRRTVVHIVLMGLEARASFEFHLGNWLGSDSDGLPVQPELARLRAEDVLCLYGEEETDSLCRSAGAAHVHAEQLPGGHHFDGAYDTLAAAILRRIPAR
ncbi:Type IV secretory pathway, VirJ component [Fontimonas thermophila]|mgnify:CR=1 FL=1|uniref:Type IV secretory pathway, VirJ component n=1 Tax=Fontimonas thermophila TaxID=1076937 RepID=A0A1I2H257_9GAMM|nr:AcvB/VirJ family lysyl-phosphatidylglycerol hydrolase [Fontimonas thermophila]SFF24344.1 Type IV secretory pathway, VirJ component [Fontimonas thermophila]